MPWVGALAHPLRGPSAAKLKEELMFQALDLVHEKLAPADLDRLLPPQDLEVLHVFLELEKEDGQRGVEHVFTHAIVGRMYGSEPWQVWFPKLPGESFVVQQMENLYFETQAWLLEWVQRNQGGAEQLQSGGYYSLESVEVDLGFPEAIEGQSPGVPRGGRWQRPETLLQVATNLLHRAEDQMLAEAYGRQQLVEELVAAMSSPRATNICLVGPSGVGKSALIGEVVRKLWEQGKGYQKRRDIWQTSGDRIIAGMSIIGQWEQRAEALCEELTARGDMLVIEDLLGLVRAGRTTHGESNVARFMEPYLEQGQFAILSEATAETWEMARELAPGFVDKFRRVHVPELSYRETLGVLTEQVRDLERQQPVRFTPDGVETILQLSRRFFRQEAFPGKAVRLAKQCFNEGVRRTNELMLREIQLDGELVARVVQRHTGLPMTILRQGNGRSPEVIRTALEERVFGQPEAVEVMTNLVLTIEQGLSDAKRPLGSFLLIGPSGVGKTETAKALAHDLFGAEERMIRFDMSEFSEPYSLTRLIGTAAQPDGELTGRVRLQPFSVLLFDEIEKASSRVLDLLLQLLGDGRLTDAAGRVVDFCNTVVIMTSNLGAASEERWLGFGSSGQKDRALHYQRSAEQFFRPEFFNRIDRVVAYRALDGESLKRIARRTVREILERRGLRQAQVLVDVDPRLIESLVQQSMDRRYGARTLAQRIERQLITPLARQLTQQERPEGLTRVTMLPGPSAEAEIDLRLQTIALARAQSRGAEQEVVEKGGAPVREIQENGGVVADLWLEGTGAEPKQERFEEGFARVKAELERLLEAPQTQQIFAEYELILARINEGALGGSSQLWLEEQAESLRQREVFRTRLEQLRRRVEGMQEAEEGNAWRAGAASLASQMSDKARGKKRLAFVAEMERMLVWLNAQMESLSSGQGDAATLVVRGLAGPYQAMLERWCAWLKVLSDELELNLSVAFYRDETWTSRGTLQGAQAFAVSGQTPGVLALFQALAGYTWVPRKPSHGQHALLVSNVFEIGISDPAYFVEWLAQTGGVETDDSGLAIEFIETDGALEDVRLGRRLALSEMKVLELVMARIGGRFLGVHGW